MNNLPKSGTEMLSATMSAILRVATVQATEFRHGEDVRNTAAQRTTADLLVNPQVRRAARQRAAGGWWLQHGSDRPIHIK